MPHPTVPPSPRQICTNCRSANFKLRIGAQGDRVCNACYVYYNNNGEHRPQTQKTRLGAPWPGRPSRVRGLQPQPHGHGGGSAGRGSSGSGAVASLKVRGQAAGRQPGCSVAACSLVCVHAWTPHTWVQGMGIKAVIRGFGHAWAYRDSHSMYQHVLTRDNILCVRGCRVRSYRPMCTFVSLAERHQHDLSRVVWSASVPVCTVMYICPCQGGPQAVAPILKHTAVHVLCKQQPLPKWNRLAFLLHVGHGVL